MSFTAPILDPGAEDVEIFFSLLVTGSVGGTAKDTVTITVEAPPPNVPPISDAGPDQTVVSGATVELDGSRSDDPDGTIASYFWERTGGTTGANVTLSDARAVKPTFTADTLTPGADDVIHTFTLEVTDTRFFSASDTVTITVEAPPPNVPPISDAGPDQTVVSGATVELDGSRSDDPDGTIASYFWERTGGTTGANVTLSDARAVKPTFTADTLTPGADDVIHTFTWR